MTTPCRARARHIGKGYGLVCRQKREDVHSVYQLVSANQADASNNLSVRAMCRVLKFSPRGYYDWQHRAPSTRRMANLVLTEAIRKAHNESDQTYGMPRARRTARGQVQRQPKARCALDAQRLHPRCEPASRLHGDYRAGPQATDPSTTARTLLARFRHTTLHAGPSFLLRRIH